MNQLVYAINIYWAHENKIQAKSWISNFVGRAGGGAFYRLNLSSQQCTKAIMVKHKLRCLQWHNFLLKKVNSSIELWHKLTLKVSKKIPAPSVLIPTRASTAPTKNRVLKAKFRSLRVSFFLRGVSYYFWNSSFAILSVTVYFQFDDAKLITEFYATMALSSHFFKPWNNLPRSKNIPFSTPLNHSMYVHRK